MRLTQLVAYMYISYTQLGVQVVQAGFASSISR